jgi:hypothetical protein
MDTALLRTGSASYLLEAFQLCFTKVEPAFRTTTRLAPLKELSSEYRTKIEGRGMPYLLLSASSALQSCSLPAALASLLL